MTSIAARLRNTLQGPIKEKIFFLHIPKCGGNSIKEALRNKYITMSPRSDTSFAYIHSNGMGKVMRLLNEEESTDFNVSLDCRMRVPEYLLLYHMSHPHIKCIVAHAPFSTIAFRNYGKQYAFITILRDPVERWISEFYYNKQSLRGSSDMDMDQYLDSEYGKAQGTQYVLFLSGRANGNDHYSSKAVKRAIENLKCFSMVGILEDLDDFTERFHKRFGVTLDIGKKNVTRTSRDKQQITSDMRQQIETICERDLEIYHHAKKLMPEN